MRDIKFRGKRVDNDKWIYGYYTVIKGTNYISEDVEDGIYFDHTVIPETVGQYTGLKDKNNVDIYGGEIIFNDDRNEHAIVTYSEERAMFICTYVESNDVFPLWQTLSNLYYSVGNIYENKNLLTAQ